MITSLKNDRVKYLVQLQKSSRARRDADVYVAEGARIVSEIPADKLIQIIVSESYFQKKQGSLPDYAREALCEGNGSTSDGVSMEIMSDAVFRHIAGTENPQGIMAVVRMDHYSTEDLLGGKNAEGTPERKPLLMVLDELQDPGNLGTILRSCEAAGATGLIMSRGCADIYNPKVVRSTMGTLFRVPFIYTDDLCETIKTLGKEHGITFYAAALEGAVEYTVPDYTGNSAIIIGNEGNGIRESVIRAADAAVCIPMEGHVESLNAGVAASIMLYEAYRQRSIRRGC